MICPLDFLFELTASIVLAKTVFLHKHRQRIGAFHFFSRWKEVCKCRKWASFSSYFFACHGFLRCAQLTERLEEARLYGENLVKIPFSAKSVLRTKNEPIANSDQEFLRVMDCSLLLHPRVLPGKYQCTRIWYWSVMALAATDCTFIQSTFIDSRIYYFLS